MKKYVFDGIIIKTNVYIEVTMNLLSSITGPIIDVCIVVFTLIVCFFGAKKGFVRSFLSTFGSFISIIIALALCSTVTNFLEAKFGLVTTLSSGVSDLLTQIFGQEIMHTTLMEATEATLNDSNLTAWLVKMVLDLKLTGEIPMDVTLSQILSPVFGYYVANGIAILGLTIILKIIFFILSEFIKGLHKIKLIKIVDGALGLVFGLIKAVIIIQLAVLVIRIIPLEFFQNLTVASEQSSVVSFLNNNNLFAIVLNAISNLHVTDAILNLINK